MNYYFSLIGEIEIKNQIERNKTDSASNTSTTDRYIGFRENLKCQNINFSMIIPDM